MYVNMYAYIYIYTHTHTPGVPLDPPHTHTHTHGFELYVLVFNETQQKTCILREGHGKSLES